jgi:hypothetical protein
MQITGQGARTSNQLVAVTRSQGAAWGCIWFSRRRRDPIVGDRWSRRSRNLGARSMILDPGRHHACIEGEEDSGTTASSARGWRRTGTCTSSPGGAVRRPAAGRSGSSLNGFFSFTESRGRRGNNERVGVGGFFFFHGVSRTTGENNGSA